MTKHCPDQDAIAAYCDGDSCVDLDAIGRHVASCPDCAKEAAAIDLVNRAVLQGARQVGAPAALTGWIDDQSQRRSFGDRMNRRNLIGAASMAAGLGAVGLYLSLSNEQPPMAPTLFDDFSTRLAADRALDLSATRLETVMAWFETRVPFALPDLPAMAGVGLRGARLCWLLDRRVAAIYLDRKGAHSCLYVADSGGLTLDGEREVPGADAPALLTDGMASGAFWRDRDLAFGLVASTSTSAVGSLMRRLYGVG